ncbi:hypothetical protein [Streptosporangium sp. NPDC002721]|uniref:hypothetical protein n=1 Tax=Streptosporangium sp. NPDC002721 TaxID=3366188 RepID=UPI00369679F8
MPKRSSILWGAAILAALAPDVYFRIKAMASGTGSGGGGVWITFASCEGHRIGFWLNGLLDPLWDLPLLWFGSAPLIVLAWGGSLLGERAGRPRIGRILGRLVALVMIVRYLPSLLLLVIDMSGDPRCADAWGPGLTIWGVTRDLCRLASAILVLLAVRSSRTPRNGLTRTAIVVPLVIAVLLGAVGDAARGKVSDGSALDCAGFGDGTVSGLDKSEKEFLCRIRDDYRWGISALEDMPDRDLLAYGRGLCDLAVRHGGGDVDAPAVAEAIGELHSDLLAGALSLLCPEVAEVQQEKGRRAQEESDAYFAAAERACAAHPRHRPRIAPVRQARATMWTEFWEIHAWDEGNEGAEVDGRVADLVGSEPGALGIWAADEGGHACVTGESYRRRPPVETRGWEQVVEVGYRTGTGVLSIVDVEGHELPDLTAGGPGDYRVRVHVRGREAVRENYDVPDGTVQLLIMVFPGKAKEPRIYRDSLS